MTHHEDQMITDCAKLCAKSIYSLLCKLGCYDKKMQAKAHLLEEIIEELTYLSNQGN